MYGIDFAFINEWTDVQDWLIFTKINKIKSKGELPLKMDMNLKKIKKYS